MKCTFRGCERALCFGSHSVFIGIGLGLFSIGNDCKLFGCLLKLFFA